jgi:hypothetical protein
MFAAAILATCGATHLLGKLRKRGLRLAASAALMALVLGDSILRFPWPVANTHVSSFYQRVAADQRSVAVLDLPVDNYTGDSYYMLYQTAHGHAIVGGRMVRHPPEVETARARLDSLARPGGDAGSLAKHGIGYVVLHRDFLDEADLDQRHAHLAQHLGSPLYEDEAIVAFGVPEALEIAPPPVGGSR